MLHISHNAASIARGCWKKYYWKYIEGLSPIRKTLSLTLGSVIHNAFEKYYTGSADSDVVKYITDSYNDEISKVELQDQEDYVISKYTALGMWGYYPWKNINEFQECYPEKKFELRLSKLRGVRFVGRVDGLIRKDNKWWVREVKTTGLSPRQFKGRMRTSMQASGYVYAMRELGYDVQGVMYDTIRKPRMYKRQGDSMDDHGRRIMADYKDDSQKPDKERKYYVRPFVYRTQLELKQFEGDMMDLVRDLRKHKSTKQYYRNMDQCWNYNTMCPYDKICFMEKPDNLTLRLFYEKK